MKHGVRREPREVLEARAIAYRVAALGLRTAKVEGVPRAQVDRVARWLNGRAATIQMTVDRRHGEAAA